MTNDEMKIAIALDRGWKREWSQVRNVFDWWRPEPASWALSSETKIPEEVPNYPEDLNAMHEVVSALEVGHDGSEAADYQECLYGICNPGRDFTEDFCIGADVAFLHKLITATATQCAEAYLRTKGLWIDLKSGGESE